MENLSLETIKEIVNRESYNDGLKTKEEILSYLSSFSVELEKNKCAMIKAIERIWANEYKSFLDCSLILQGIDKDGNNGMFIFHVRNINNKKTVNTRWVYA